MKPLVLLDVDGVLADIVGSVLDYIEEEGGRRYTHNHVVIYDILASIPEPRHIKDKAWARIKGPGGCRNIRPYLSSFSGVAQLREIADIHIVTTPFEGSFTWMEERKEWLKKHYGFRPEDITFTHRKDLLEADYIVDDKPENVMRLKGGLLWHQPYNKYTKTMAKRVQTWEQVLQEVRAWSTT